MKGEDAGDIKYIMRVKDTVFEKLKELTIESNNGISAADLAEHLSMRRNLVSQYLNELVMEQRVVKSNTRPVLFQLMSNETEEGQNQEEKTDVFSSFIGAQGSLQYVIEQCRSAVQYPGKGLPILLNGSSGVGKSFLAELIHSYAVESENIKKDAPFITLNCADYASNPELLSALLFGYAKGAFTGAEQAKAGLIQQADEGYLFLDEVHRLSSESQEKLFLLMDKNEYRRIGETDTVRKAHVRMIFATTEDPQTVLTHTLRRRIPMIIHIPSLQERPIKEKLELIRLFYYRECQVFEQEVCVRSQVINLLLSLHAEGNVGSLQNIIRYSCASAFHSSQKRDQILVDVPSLPADCKLSQIEMKEYVKEDLVVHRLQKLQMERELHHEQDLTNILREFQSNYVESKHEFQDIGTMQKALYRILDTYHLAPEHALQASLIEVVITDFEEKNGIHLAMNTGKIITCLLERYGEDCFKDLDKSFTAEIQRLEGYHFKLFSVAQRLIYQLETALGIHMRSHLQFYILLYIIVTNCGSKAVCCNALIMAHGNSTATSISSAANEMLEEYIFEAFDMPIHTSYELFSTLLKKYMERINPNYPTLILVDMGSLMEIDKYMEVNDYQEIGIIDSVSTALALQVGDMIRKEVPIAKLLQDISEQTKLHYRYLPPKKRKKAVVCVCISGIGTAEKIKDIMKDFVQPEYELLTCDYMKIMKEGKNNQVFHDYDVQCLVGTSDLDVADMDCININHLMNNEQTQDIAIFMDKIVGADAHADFNLIQQKIIKSFSLENLINRLVFLNPQTIIDDVETVIFDTEIGMHLKFDTDIRMMLFLHVAVLIERALLKNCDEDIYQSEAWMLEHKSEIKLISKAFSRVEKKFNIHITDAEIVSILSMIQMRK